MCTWEPIGGQSIKPKTSQKFFTLEIFWGGGRCKGWG